MQQKLRVLHKTFFTKVNEIFYWEVKKSNFSSRKSFWCALLTSDVHFKADVVKNEEELSFSVDIEEK